MHLTNHHPDQEKEHLQRPLLYPLPLSQKEPIFWLLTLQISFACFWTSRKQNRAVLNIALLIGLFLFQTSFLHD